MARLAVVVAIVLLVIPVLLMPLPPSWIELSPSWQRVVEEQTIVVRLGLLAGGVVLLVLGRNLLMARLPRAAIMFGRTVRFHDGTRRRALPIAEIAAIHVELRPPPYHEVFVIEQQNGEEHDLCPTHWTGAPGLHRTLERKVAAAHRRRARARARSQTRSRP